MIITNTGLRGVVYMRLPWFGASSKVYTNIISPSIRRCFNSVVVRKIFLPDGIFHVVPKDVLLTNHKSSVDYRYKCQSEVLWVKLSGD